MTFFKYRRIALLTNIGVCCGGLLMSGYAVAAAEYNTLEEIVVVAQKREQLANKVGAAITAFSSEQMEAYGFQSSSDIAMYTPGLYFAEGPLSHIALTNIRGVSQNDFTGNIEPPNAIYIDQAYISFQGASAFQLFDMERVEVLKGPQGTLYGRNATGGLLHYLTKAPTKEFEGYATVRIGELGEVRVEGAVSGPVSDTLSLRISTVILRKNDYIKNEDGPDLMGFRDYGVRGQFLWEPSEEVTARLIVAFSEQDHSHAFQNSATGFDPISGLEFLLARDQNYYGNCEGCDAGGFRDDNGPFTANQDSPNLYVSKNLNVTGILNWDITDTITLTSVSNVVEYKFDYQEDSDLTPAFGLLGKRTGDYFQASEELRLNGDTDRLHWVTGLYYLSRDTDDTADQTFGIPWLDGVLANLGAIAPGDLLDLGDRDQVLSDFTMNTRSWAVFGQVEYDLTEKVTVIGGLRWSHDASDYSFVSTEHIDGVPSGPAVFGETTFTKATVGDLAENNKGEWSGHLALNYHPSENILTYISYYRANKAGAWNAPFTGGDVTPLKQEVLTSVEGGFKATLLDKRMQLNMSVFHYFYEDYQGFIFQNLATSLTNLDADVTGVEAEIDLAPGDGWRLRFGAAYLNSSADTNVPAEGGVRDSILPLAPTWNLNGLAQKTWAIGNGFVTAQAGIVYTGEQFSDILNTPAGHLESRIIGNARLSYTTEDDRFSVALIARNLGDDDKPIFRIPTHVGYTQDMYDHPTQFLVEISYKFH